MAAETVAQPKCSAPDLMRDTPKTISVGTANDPGNMTLVALFLTKLLPSQRMFPGLSSACPVVSLDDWIAFSQEQCPEGQLPQVSSALLFAL